MFKWLWNNKEWLFSGVGIVAIVLIITFVKWIKRRKTAQENAKQSAEPLDQKAGSSLSAAEIRAAIDRAPFLQRLDVIKHYIGLRVSWDGKLTSAWKLNEKTTRVMILVEEKNRYLSAMGDVEISKYPGLALLKEEHPIHMSGTISNISEYSGYFSLKDVKIKYSL